MRKGSCCAKVRVVNESPLHHSHVCHISLKALADRRLAVPVENSLASRPGVPVDLKCDDSGNAQGVAELGRARRRRHQF